MTARKLSSLCEAKKVISEKSEAGQWVMDGDGVSRDLRWFKGIFIVSVYWFILFFDGRNM